VLTVNNTALYTLNFIKRVQLVYFLLHDKKKEKKKKNPAYFLSDFYLAQALQFF
jgi:hypothetical protein